jgi:hypothetical protein
MKMRIVRRRRSQPLRRQHVVAPVLVVLPGGDDPDVEVGPFHEHGMMVEPTSQPLSGVRPVPRFRRMVALDVA